MLDRGGNVNASSPSRYLAAPPLLLATLVIAFACAPAPADAHEHTIPWLDESTLDGGLYVELGHPRVIRKAGPFDVSLFVNNLTGRGDVRVKGVRYSLPGAFDTISHPREHRLRSRRPAYRQYKTVQGQLRGAANRRDRAAVKRLQAQSQSLLVSINSDTFRDRQRFAASLVPDVGGSLDLTVEIDVLQSRKLRTIRRSVRIPIQPALPGSTASWFAGDQHLHTLYSIDALFLEGTIQVVTDYAMTAETVGLDWIIITDHTNLGFLFWYTPELFAAGEAMAQAYRNTNDYLVLQGQEMGIGSPGFFEEAAHLLVYPRLDDSTGFLPNPCPGLLFNHVNCESEQVILDRVNDNGGIGFIAHPFDSVFLFFAPWDLNSPAVGWAGLEIFNSDLAVFSTEDQQSVNWWHSLLNDIAPPQGGQLADRPGYPTRFPVGLGNSDAHQPGKIGNTFTYAYLPAVTPGSGMLPRADLMDAFVNGRVVASNGPLVYGEINGAGTGQVATLSPGDNQLAITLQTTTEFGPVGDYEIHVAVNGVSRIIVPPSGSPAHQTTILLEDLLAPPDKFVTIQARRASGTGQGIEYRAIANPIWLEFTLRNATTDLLVERLQR